MGGFIMAAQLILSLSILVFLHELGHYLAARMFGIRVEKFYIFFDAWGKKLFSFKKGDTEYGIGWLPLGGYVKIAGMIDESMDKEQMKLPPKPDEFRSKPAWQRFIVMIGGIVMNLITGTIFMAFTLGFFSGGYYKAEDVNKSGGIYPYSLGQQFGLQKGDKLLKINGKEKLRFRDYNSPGLFLGGTLEVERHGEPVVIEVSDKHFTEFSKTNFIEPSNRVVIDSVMPETPAAQAGLKQGDEIIRVNGKDVFSFGHNAEILSENKGEIVNIDVKRNGAVASLQAKVDTSGKLGFFTQLPLPSDVEKTPYSFGQVWKYGLKDGVDLIIWNAKGFVKIAQGKVPARESVQSPVGIATMFGAQWHWGRFWSLTAVLSFILAFMNFLPIPALDGGHMMFLSWEMITGKPVPDKVLEVAQIVGFVLLMALMIFAFGNDILKLFGI